MASKLDARPSTALDLAEMRKTAPPLEDPNNEPSAAEVLGRYDGVAMTVIRLDG